MVHSYNITFTVPSLLADMTLWVSGRKTAMFTNEACPLNSLRVLPDLRPWILGNEYVICRADL